MTDKELSDTLFNAFWKAFPNRQGKKAAIDKFTRLDIETQRLVVSHVQERATSDAKWVAGYCPMPTTFFNQERWEDEYEVVKGKSSATVKDSIQQVICNYCRADTRGSRHLAICESGIPYFDVKIKDELWKFAEGTMFQVHP